MVTKLPPDVGTRIQALTLAEQGHRYDFVTEVAGVPRRTIYAIKKKALERGYNPEVSKLLKLEYLEDAPRSGRPRTIFEDKEDEVPAIVNKDRNRREKNLDIIGFEAGISAISGWRILRRLGFRKRKPTYKPRLTPTMKAQRLQ